MKQNLKKIALGLSLLVGLVSTENNCCAAQERKGAVSSSEIATESKERAIEWLNSGRKPDGLDCVMAVNLCREELKMAGLKPQDIGTSDEELVDILHKGSKTLASNWLRVARENTDGNSVNAVAYCRENLRAANLRPQDIGTSDEELNGLLRKGYRDCAMGWLRIARETKIKNVRMDAIDYCRDELRIARLEPHNIGSSEQELSDLLSKK